MKTKSVEKLTDLRTQLSDIEQKIIEIYEKYRQKTEGEIIECLDTEPGIFYRYARSKSLVKHEVGGLKDKHGIIKTSDKEIA